MILNDDQPLVIAEEHVDLDQVDLEDLDQVDLEQTEETHGNFEASIPSPISTSIYNFFFLQNCIFYLLFQNQMKNVRFPVRFPEAEGTCAIPKAEGSQEDQGTIGTRRNPNLLKWKVTLISTISYSYNTSHTFFVLRITSIFFVSLEPQRGAIPCAIPEAEGSQEDQYGHRDQQEQKSSEVEG